MSYLLALSPKHIQIVFNQERIKGTKKASPINTLFRRDKVTSRAAWMLAWMWPCKTCRAKGNESVKRSRAFLNIEAK